MGDSARYLFSENLSSRARNGWDKRRSLCRNENLFRTARIPKNRGRTTEAWQNAWYAGRVMPAHDFPRSLLPEAQRLAETIYTSPNFAVAFEALIARVENFETSRLNDPDPERSHTINAGTYQL